MYTLKKSLGQHFLHDEDMCQKIVALLDVKSGMNLLEVGPGGGAITKYLIQLPDVIFKAIEIDTEKIDYLNKTYPAIAGKIISKDILQADIPFEGNFSVIGNFPYNISSPILFKILDWEPQVQEVIGMFQKEVAMRVAAGPGSKTYGILSVLMQAFYKVEFMIEVHENSFTPPPKVKSGVLKFTSLHNPHNINDKRKFKILVKAAFGQRRKTLRNALKSVVPAAALLEPIMDKRAEQLSVLDFVGLYERYFL
ncbi:ribosomal RNA small subunit methyltransferase A [Flavipsychrobacter stenotrophus]|uniref:Ribosomal RNA small subunit methyltransferase A n=1 Tax=Flavipsychrobacter stenotrophus TaxID=2077091 RepID=A0A2S7SQF5_9BACT|nr:16S rRNA (adenine(1518)-N(6)/adenine(1519)-N(6))-dimethyltransferase RsmA [Flavipsychrobacter stenotrophus]PQJ08835.1 ribosomal RNA small subunit methyltransferase A [Flavipsychrobacter stenotrophus]